MARVISVGTAICICQNCKSTIEYEIREVKEDYSTDYTGGIDRYKYIDCPACNKKAVVR